MLLCPDSGEGSRVVSVANTSPTRSFSVSEANSRRAILCPRSERVLLASLWPNTSTNQIGFGTTERTKTSLENKINNSSVSLQGLGTAVQRAEEKEEEDVAGVEK